MAGNKELLDYYRDTHSRRVYGTSSVKYVRFLRPWVSVRKPKSILDYGCGQSIFLEQLEADPGIALRRYDPAIPDYARPPEGKSDLLVCIDVMEHIEERDVDTLLAEMRAWSKDAIIIIDTVPAKHTLPDGRNAHITVRPHAWWQERIVKAFGIAEPVPVPRKTRAGFRTWVASPEELKAFRRQRLVEDVGHYARRVFRRHKTAWKVSSTGPKSAT